nr:EOG090X0FKI [Lepidurus arcticus]
MRILLFPRGADVLFLLLRDFCLHSASHQGAHGCSEGYSKSPLNGTAGEHGYLYSPKLLSKINHSDNFLEQSKKENIHIRPLHINDYEKGFLQILSQLTVVGDISREEFEAQFEVMKSSPETYYVTVLEDKNTHRVIGSATLLLERKFVRQCAIRARVEDVVVSDAYRGKQLGKTLVQALISMSRIMGSYKISLDCNDKMIPFYESLGFVGEAGNANTLVIRLSGKPKL